MQLGDLKFDQSEQGDQYAVIDLPCGKRIVVWPNDEDRTSYCVYLDTRAPTEREGWDEVAIKEWEDLAPLETQAVIYELIANAHSYKREETSLDRLRIKMINEAIPQI